MFITTSTPSFCLGRSNLAGLPKVNITACRRIHVHTIADQTTGSTLLFRAGEHRDLQQCYQHPDAVTILAVALGGVELREAHENCARFFYTVLSHLL